MAIAMQQPRPAIHSSTWIRVALKPSDIGGRSASAAAAAFAWVVTRIRRRNTKLSGNIVTMQNMPTEIYVSRQPMSAIIACTTCGQIAPATYWPLATIAIAIPRRRSNQCVTSASNGANSDDVPSKPINRPCAAANSHRFGA